MAGNILSAVIDVKAPGAVQSVKAVSTAVDGASKSFSNLQKQVAAFGGGVRSFAPAVSSASSALKNVSGTSSAATQSLINFGRIIQDAPYGVIGFANNLNPLFEGFARLQKQTGSTGAAIKALGKDLLGAGGISLAISLVSSALIVFGDKIFGASVGIKDADLEAQKLAISFREIKEGIDNFEGFEDFIADLDKLRAALEFGEGFKADITGLGIEFEKNAGRIDRNNAAIDRAIDRIGTLRSDLASFGSDDAKKLLRAFPGSRAAEIADEDIKKLKKADAERILIIKESQIRINELRKQNAEASKENQRIELQIQIKKNEEQKRLDKEAEGEYQRYVSSIIAKGKALAGELKNIAIVPEFTIFDTSQEQFRKALKLISDFEKAQLKITVPVELDLTPPAEIKPAATTMAQLFGKEFNSYFEGGQFDPSIFRAMNEWAKDARIRQAGADLANSFSSALQSAITNSLSAFGEGLGNILSGRDFGSSLINAIGGFIQEIGKALIAFGNIKKIVDQIFGPGGFAIPGGVAIALGVAAIAIGQAFKNFGGFRAAGGPVGAGQSYIVGERGPERFVPNTGGRIIPNHQIGSAHTGMGGGEVVFRQRGADLVAVLSYNQLKQLRLV